MNNFRDLLFHSVEKPFTLPQLAQILENLELEFLGFEISDPAVINRYRQRFPHDLERRSLENWQEFELEFSETFANCHALWLRK